MTDHAPAVTTPMRQLKRRLVGVFVAVGLFSLLANLLLLAAPLYMLQVYDRVLASRSEETLAYLTIIALAALMAYAALDYIRARILNVVSGWLDRNLRRDVFRTLLRDRAAGLPGSPSMLNHVATLRNTFAGAGIQACLDAPWTPIFIAALFLLHPLLGWIVVAGAGILLLLAMVNSLVTRNAAAESDQASTQGSRLAMETVRNADSIEAMGMADGLARRIEHWNEAALAGLNRASIGGGLVSALSRFLRYGLQIVVLGSGAWLVLNDSLTAGAIVAASILAARALAPVDKLISSWQQIASGRRSYRAIADHLAIPRDARSTMTLPKPEGRLDVKQLTFARHPDDTPTLRNITFSLPAGESLGIVGATASGKTTLARILVGSLVPQSGHARLDGADMGTWAAEDRGRHVGYLPQAVELMPGSVRDNIARLGEGDDEAVIRAARRAGVHELILALPNGYDTDIGPSGSNLSGGQRQQIALARALYGDPSLVVMDEPNASLDRHGEDELFKALCRLKRDGVTTVVVSHRPNVMRAVDSLLVLQSGRIATFGPRDTVLAEITKYREQKAIAQ